MIFSLKGKNLKFRQMQKFEGLIAAPFTPMNENGEVNYDQIRVYYDFLKKNNVVGVFINGSTGEGVSLTQKERMKIAEHWVAAAKENKGVKTINLVGGTSYMECIENAKHSEETGTDAVAVLAPFYFKPAEVIQLVDFVSRVAESVPQMPVYFYHIPVFTGCTLPMFDFLQVADSAIPNLAGIKYTHEDFMDFQSCINFMDGKYDMLSGRDESLLPALALGTRSGVGSTFNFASPLYYKLIEAFDKGDFDTARKLQQKAIDMIRLLGKYGGIATGKAFMRYVGLDFGGFRSPVKNMSKEDYKNFVDDVRALEMDEFFSVK